LLAVVCAGVATLLCSHVHEAADPYAGLMGSIIITKPENANEDGTPKDVTVPPNVGA
jgi:hypothetical protein